MRMPGDAATVPRERSRVAPGPESAAQVRAAWARLTAPRPPESDPAPQYLDIAVRVRSVPQRSSTTKLLLEVFTEAGQPLGRAWSFPAEWYPGCRRTVPFSHYFLVLQ